MKKTISAILAAILLSSSFAACSNNDVETSTDTPVSGSTTELLNEPEGETTRAEISDNLPAKNFDGRTFTLLTRDGYGDKFQPEELTGEAVNDAIFERNSKITERFNINLTYVSKACEWGTQSTQWNNELYNSVMANDGAYDLVAGYASTIPEVVTKNILLNWKDIPYIDLSQSWWSERASEALTINDRLYLLTGDYSISLWDNMFGFLFNKQVAEDFRLDDMYDIVRSGQWTLDLLLTLSSGVSMDADGNGTWDENDIYGMISNWSTSIDTFQTSCNMAVVSHTANGSLEITLNSERAVSILEKVCALYNSTHGAYTFSEGGDLTTYNNMFSENRALFYAIFFDNITALRDMEADFGILPYPKFDETQTEYSSTSRDNFDLFVVPIDVKDTEFTGIITEALCAESYRSVIPDYYDVVLKTKTSRDEESAEMIDLIRDSLTFDIGYLCSTSLNSIGHIFVNLVRTNSTDLASSYASSEKAAQVKLNEMLAAYGIE